MKLTRPGPVPVAGDESEIHTASATAVHAHSLAVVIVRLPAPPVAAIVWLAGPTSYRQGARWDTRTCCPFTSIIPSRTDDSSLAATRKDTFAVPCPDEGANAEIQFTFVDTSHAHSGCVVMLRVPLPPLASIIGGALSETTHLRGLGPVVTVEEVPHPDTRTVTSSATPTLHAPRGPTQALLNCIACLGIPRRCEQATFQRIRCMASALYRRSPCAGRV